MIEVPSGDLRQRVLEVVTDSGLAQLEFEKLSEVLLLQARELFAVDTVTLLLVDESGAWLVATAAAGLEEEVFQGVRVPVGSGFAGRVAASGVPLVLDRVDSSTVLNPLLWGRGLRTLLGVPMVVGGRVTGVVHVGRTTSRPFVDAEIDALKLVADRLALAAYAHRSRSERSAAAMLQASLLPAHLPAVPGWELAARYVAGADAGVGGDWYDVFHLPGDRLGLVIGDVVGNGLGAAVVMGRLRSALRAYALEFDDPAEVLTRLDRKASHFERDIMATVGYAIIDTVRERVRVASAGHLRPVLTVSGKPATYAEMPVGPPVGRSLGLHGRKGATLDLPRGALLALFTDGLVERRGVDVDARLDKLLEAIEHAPASPESVCAKVMATMVGTTAATDDIALLVARHTP